MATDNELYRLLKRIEAGKMELYRALPNLPPELAHEAQEMIYRIEQWQRQTAVELHYLDRRFMDLRKDLLAINPALAAILA
ncbi:MAG TPA: hypothetical protein VNQ78_16145 [Paracoccus sp. (in: a-proteobacteria)]|uniref:hypothetical protein n=1 Tax=Paracoccus sp. TaxID=267 RepID=UPI002D07065E|nr:hypothetical protein [Paracoccus sp. (in: a-proteobacteria)]HWL58192.1 hypothetical protein [Paracoccus sp. (in: a-proteobacteria)]